MGVCAQLGQQMAQQPQATVYIGPQNQASSVPPAGLEYANPETGAHEIMLPAAGTRIQNGKVRGGAKAVQKAKQLQRHYMQ